MGVGARLRAAREGRQLTLKAIAETTKISRVTLEAIEDEAWTRIPGGIFTRAYVRSFAHEVGLDAEQVVEQFLAEVPSAGEELPFHIEDGRPARSWGVVTAWMVASAVAAVGLVAAWPSVGRWMTPRAAPAAVESAVPGPQFADASLPGANDAAISLTNQAEPVSDAGGGTGDAVGPDEAGDDALNAAEGIRVVIEPRADCWVRASVDGAVRFARIVRAGERQALEGAAAVVVHVGNAGAFDYTVNGQPGRPLGREGQVVTARIDLDTMTDFIAR